MTWSIVVAAVKPWTYWFAPVLLIAGVLLVVGIAVGYYRRVAVPAFQWRLQEEQRRLAEQRPELGTVHHLRQRREATASANAA